jgi:hypothetical protein
MNEQDETQRYLPVKSRNGERAMPKKKMNELDICPDDEILRDYAAGNETDYQNLSIIECHLEFCASCRALVSQYRNTGAIRDRNVENIVKRLKERQAEVRRRESAGAVPGSIWRAVPDSDERLFGPLLFVIAAAPEVVLVAEVSEEMAQAIDTDVALESAESGLPFAFMVRSDNTFLVRRESLKAFAGVLSSELTQRVVDFCCSAGQMGPTAAPQEYVFVKDPEGAGLVRRRGVKSTTQVFDGGDPRLTFLEAGKRRCVYLHAELESDSVILRGPLNQPLSVITGEGSGLSGIETLHQSSNQVYNSVTFWGVVGRVLPIIAALSVMMIALQIPQPQTHTLYAGRSGASLGALVGQAAALGMVQSSTNRATPSDAIVWSARILLHFFSAMMLFILARRTCPRLAWLAFCPAANIFLMVRLAGKPVWWTLLLLLPLLAPPAAFMQPLPVESAGVGTLAGLLGGAVSERALVLLSLPFDWSLIIPSLSTILVNPPTLLVFEASLILIFVVVWCSVTMGITVLKGKSMIWGILLAIPITAPISLGYLAWSEP